MSTATIPLYSIIDELAEIEAVLEERGGDLDDEIEARLDAIESDFEAKIERLCGWRANLLGTAKAYQDEADRMSKRARTLTRTADSLKRYLHAQLYRAGRTKLEAGTWRLRVQSNSQPSVIVSVAPETLPEEYTVVRVDANRRALLDAAERGETLPAGVVVTRGSHLRIS